MGSKKIRRLHLCRGVSLPAPNECPGYDTKLHLMVRLQLWNFGKCGVPLHCHHSQVHSDLVWYSQVMSRIVLPLFFYWEGWYAIKQKKTNTHAHTHTHTHIYIYIYIYLFSLLAERFIEQGFWHRLMISRQTKTRKKTLSLSLSLYIYIYIKRWEDTILLYFLNFHQTSKLIIMNGTKSLWIT